MSTKAQETMDAELIALAALARVEAVLMEGDNKAREDQGLSPAWSSGCGFMPATSELQQRLYERGYKV
jgi:hypothetical protein